VNALAPKRVRRGGFFQLKVTVSDLSANRTNTASFNYSRD
jgi:hypothetical protein